MKFEEAKKSIENEAPFEDCIWRESWPNNSVDDCACVMKDDSGGYKIYRHPFVDVYSDDVLYRDLTKADLQADDWICGVGVI